jgi:hypothetical protein
MKDESAIPLAKEILLRFTPPSNKVMIVSTTSGDNGNTKICGYFKSYATAFAVGSGMDKASAVYGLKGEALSYLYSVFNNKQARDIYVDMVMQKRNTWYGVFYVKGKVYKYLDRRNPLANRAFDNPSYPYWYGPYRASTALILNVFQGIPLLITNHDSRVEDVCIYFLTKMPYQPDESSVFVKMNSGGWYPWAYSGKTYGNLMLDSKQRCRMVAMRYLRQLKSRKAIPALEKLLNSTHPDERDFALATLEEITSGGNNSANPTAEVSEKEKYDKIVLRNGDTLSGQVMNTSLHLKTSYGSLEFKTSTMAYIKLEGADSKTDAIELRNSDKLTGTLDDETFTINLKAGQIIPIKKKDISSISFRRVWK